MLIVVIGVYFWPANLGGATRIVTVSGHSMEPTYDLGDIVITRDTGDTSVGDIVVFEVPSGAGAGLLVIHRVVAVDENGRFITQGDNRRTPDDWPLTEADIVGEPLLHIPHAGIVLGWFQQLWVAALAAGVAVVVLLWPTGRRADREDAEVDEDSSVPSVDASEPAVLASSNTGVDESDQFDRLDELISDEAMAEAISDEAMAEAISDEAMAEAIAWLDDQLAAVGQPSSS